MRNKRNNLRKNTWEWTILSNDIAFDAELISKVILDLKRGKAAEN